MIALIATSADCQSAIQPATSRRYVAMRIAIILLLACLVTARSDDWPMLGHDAARSSASSAEIRPPFARKWYRLFPEEGIQSGVQPVVSENRVFIGTLAGVLHAINAETGQDLWSYKAGGPILHAAAVGEQRVFFTSADGAITALNVSNGKPIWSRKTGAALWNAPAVALDLVFVGGRDGCFYALDAASGKVGWQAKTGAPIVNSPAIDVRAGRAYVGSESMRVHAFDLADGHPLWTSEPLPGASFRGYYPVIAPDGSVMITTAPVIGYDRFQALLLDMAHTVFGDFASWRHKPEENDKLRAENFKLMERPETYRAQLEYLRRRLTEEPAFQTFFVLDPANGRQRFVAPIVASESMNGPGAPPVVTADGRVIVKFQALLRSRYEHYSPFLNVGWLDTRTGDVTPIMDQSRTYGWHDSLLLVHDEQSQLSVAGKLLINTHQDNVNAMDLETLKGFPEPFAVNIHEPAPGEALAIQLKLMRGENLPEGSEWLMRGTAVHGGGSVLDEPVAIAGDSFYFLPTHEINSGCALIAYRAQNGASGPRKTTISAPQCTSAEWARIQQTNWDWDTLATPRLRSLLDALPGKVPGTYELPLTADAAKIAAAIPDSELDEFIWKPAFDPSQTESTDQNVEVAAKLDHATRELISQPWAPLLLPAGKAPEQAQRFFTDPAGTVYTLLLARPHLDRALQEDLDRYLQARMTDLPRSYRDDTGQPRTPYDTPTRLMNATEEPSLDDLARLYPLWLWSRTPAGIDITNHWPQLRERISIPAPRDEDDCGNARLAGLIAYCRFAKAANDAPALERGLQAARTAMRKRLTYEFSYTRGGLIRSSQHGRAWLIRWHHLTPDVARLLARYTTSIQQHLMSTYVDYHRPGWWLAWNVEQLMRNEVAYQLPSTPMDIFAAKTMLLGEPASMLEPLLDLPWCKGDEFYLQKLALTLMARSTSEDGRLKRPK